MSTRSTTHFLWNDGTLEAIVYRHSDGYPEVAGADLLRFLEEEKTRTPSTGSRVGDPSYLAARYVVFLASQFRRSENPLDFLNVGIYQEDPPDIEYRYTVGLDGTVRCYDLDEEKEVPLSAFKESST